MRFKQSDISILLNMAADMRRVANLLVCGGSAQRRTVEIFLKNLKRDLEKYKKIYPDIGIFCSDNLVRKRISKENRRFLAEEFLTASLRLQHRIGF